MKKPNLKRILAGGIVLFAVIQFVRPEKNIGPAKPGPDSLVVRHQTPPEIRRMLEVSCNDCHSGHTRYPWYAEIQPVGWFLAWHVRNGKSALNLSDFGRLSEKAQVKRLQYMVDAMQEREMPLTSYRLIHRDAELSKAQVKAFATWAESVQAKLER